MSHDLCLTSHDDEFLLVGNPDAEGPGLGRHTVFNGNAGTVVEWYARYCNSLEWAPYDWFYHLSTPIRSRPIGDDAHLGLAKALGVTVDKWRLILNCEQEADRDSCAPSPEWASPDPVARHIAMVNAFLAFAPDAKFGAS